MNCPVDFKTNENKLRKSLEALGWPVKEADIDLVKKEIGIAKKYLKQSEDIRKFIGSANEELEKVPKKNEGIAEGTHVLACFDKNGYFYTGRC